MTGRLERRIAMVVGAGSSGPGWGNGKATAVAFARAGAKVMAVDIDADAAAETVALIEHEGGGAVAWQADTTDSAAIERTVEACVAEYGRLDILHYNVGIEGSGGCVATTEDKWRRTMETNVTGCFLMCRQVLPIMERQGSGVILTTGSVAGIRWTGIDMVAYSASKGALIQLTRAVAMEYAAKGVRAVSILPGLMNTPLIYGKGMRTAYGDSAVETMIARRNAQCPTGQMGEAWDVANAAVFLASDEAKYITGTELLVDGGIAARCA